mgnify:CR=1 FL=1
MTITKRSRRSVVKPEFIPRKRLQRHLNANDGDGSAWIHSRLNRSERVFVKDENTQKFVEIK